MPPMAAAPPVRLPDYRDLDVDNRRVFVRVDFNTPLTEDGKVRDDSRIRAALPTLANLRERGARLILASHLGRPKGVADPAYSMEPIATRLAELLDCEVKLPDEVIGDGVSKLVLDTRAGQIVLLENLRFHPGETNNDEGFAAALASLADAYVNDAFGVSHRAHASVVAVPHRIRARAAGQLVMREVSALSRLVDAPEHPFVAVVGGAKVSDKLGVLLAVVERLEEGDSLLIGGAMANTFLAANGHDLAQSLTESDRVSDCRAVVAKASARGVSVVLPIDLVVARKLQASKGRTHRIGQGALAEGEMALDIGPVTAHRFANVIEGARMLFWNGPMGLFENEAFAAGTRAVAEAVARCSGYTVVGGGDSVAALNGLGLTDQVDHVSTGGGASLEYLEGQVLPGLAALIDTERAQ